MNDFDIILGMDWIHKCYAFIDCRSRVVRFYFPNKLELVREEYDSSRSGPLISNLKANKMISKGSLLHLVSVNDLDCDVSFINSLLVVNEFQDVFPDDFLESLPLEILILVST